MATVGLDHVADIGLEPPRRMASGEVGGEEEIEARPQFLGGLINGLCPVGG